MAPKNTWTVPEDLILDLPKLTPSTTGPVPKSRLRSPDFRESAGQKQAPAIDPVIL